MPRSDIYASVVAAAIVVVLCFAFDRCSSNTRAAAQISAEARVAIAKERTVRSESRHDLVRSILGRSASTP